MRRFAYQFGKETKMMNVCAQDSGLSAGVYPDLLPCRVFHLQRLIVMLESGSSGSMNSVSNLIPPDANELSLLARLRQAHARYALRSGGMERVGSGAWMAKR